MSDNVTEIDSKDVLDTAVVEVTGNSSAAARPGQRLLSDKIMSTLLSDGQHLAATAETGVGKSLAYLAPAMTVAAQHNARSVISTDSLALQDQIVVKDAPKVAAACRKVFGVTPTVAVHKGWQNYICTRAAHDTAVEAIDQAGIKPVIDTGKVDVYLTNLATAVRTTGTRDAELVAWALETSVEPDVTGGERRAYPGAVSGDSWDHVTVSTAECVGKSKCPFASQCLPSAARAKVAEADIVVTNHTMLGIQAAKGAPVLFGSPSVGDFDNLIIDEAHEMPSKVRSQGASDISARRFDLLLGALDRFIDAQTQEEKLLFESARKLADILAADLEELADERLEEIPARQRRFTRQVTIPAAFDEALGESLPVSINETLTRFTAICRKIATQHSGTKAELKARRLVERINALDEAVTVFAAGKHGYARWLEKDDSGQWAGYYSPVEVSSLLKNECYETPLLLPADVIEYLAESGCVDIHGPLGHTDECFGDTPTDDSANIKAARDKDGRMLAGKSLNIVAVSATMPETYPAEAGMYANVLKYESPFGDAYARSAFWVPQASSDADVTALQRPGGRHGALDTSRHPAWAANHVVNLVRLNAGQGTLVLASTSAAGKLYAERLRATFGTSVNVMSQWDGYSKQHLTERWKADTASVLVGTRSYMTGIDAPGPTCSLVVIDRIPRNPSGPVDDARMGVLKDKLGGNKAPDVYAVDAALLLEQAIGRLIRSEGDEGLVAVLDPRLHKKSDNSAFRYFGAARQMYVAPLKGRFGKALSRWSDVEAWFKAKEYAQAGTHSSQREAA